MALINKKPKGLCFNFKKNHPGKADPNATIHLKKHLSLHEQDTAE